MKTCKLRHCEHNLEPVRPAVIVFQPELYALLLKYCVSGTELIKAYFRCYSRRGEAVMPAHRPELRRN
jgi:hypothetical protein